MQVWYAQRKNNFSKKKKKKASSRTVETYRAYGVEPV